MSNEERTQLALIYAQEKFHEHQRDAREDIRFGNPAVDASELNVLVNYYEFALNHLPASDS